MTDKTVREMIEINQFTDEEIGKLSLLSIKTQEKFEKRPSHGGIVNRLCTGATSESLGLLVRECRTYQTAWEILNTMPSSILDTRVTPKQEFFFTKVWQTRARVTELLDSVQETVTKI